MSISFKAYVIYKSNKKAELLKCNSLRVVNLKGFLTLDDYILALLQMAVPRSYMTAQLHLIVTLSNMFSSVQENTVLYIMLTDYKLFY